METTTHRTYVDRRPLGAAWLADWSELSGLTGAAFAAGFTARINQCIAGLKAAGGRGIIFWDLERANSPAGYIGQPGLIESLNPQTLGWSGDGGNTTTLWNGLAMLKAAGLEIGFTVRAQVVDTTTNVVTELAGPDWNRPNAHAPAFRWLAKQIGDAEAMGATLCYVDSPQRLMQYGPGPWNELVAEFGNVELYPEVAPGWCRCSYVEARAGQFGLTESDPLRTIDPASFQLVWVGDDAADGSFLLARDVAKVRESAVQKNCLLFKPYQSNQIAIVAGIMAGLPE